MKRTIAILLSTLMLTAALTACSGTVGLDDRRAYGNVSTTPNGTVNGGSYSYAGRGRTDSYRNGAGYQNGGVYGTDPIYGGGTGMAGDR